MASANGRNRASEPHFDPDADIKLVGPSGAGAGGIAKPDDPVDGQRIVSGMAGGSDQCDDDTGDKPGSAYESVKRAMLRVREPFGLADDAMRKRHRRLWEFLTDRELPGGKRREVPRIALVAVSGGWRATITCYLLSMKFEVDFRHLDQLYDALATAFTNPDAKWVETQAGEGAKLRKEEERKRLAAQSDEVYDAVKGGRKAPSGTNS